MSITTGSIILSNGTGTFDYRLKGQNVDRYVRLTLNGDSSPIEEIHIPRIPEMADYYYQQTVAPLPDIRNNLWINHIIGFGRASGFNAVKSNLASSQLGKEHRVHKFYTVYHVDRLNSGQVVVIPPGYLSDGASIPKKFQWMMSPWGSYHKAAYIHDYLCEYLTVYENGLPITITRYKADNIFYDCMRYFGVSGTQRTIIETAVDYYRNGDYTRLGSPTATELQVGKETISNQLIQYFLTHNEWR